jgi:hypothetical protein
MSGGMKGSNDIFVLWKSHLFYASSEESESDDGIGRTRKGSAASKRTIAVDSDEDEEITTQKVSPVFAAVLRWC